MEYTKQQRKNRTKSSISENSPYQLFKIFILLTLSFGGILKSNLHAQTCNAPTNLTFTIVSSTCASNGSVRINTIAYASGSGARNGFSREYALYNSTQDSLLRPWQNDSLFTNLPPRSYVYAVRDICENGFSTVLYRTFNIANAQKALSSTISIPQHSGCDNGILLINATGNGPYTYSLVPSLNSPEPLIESEYIRPKQTSNQFTGLPSGTYYARTYDVCEEYFTREVQINTVQPSPISTNTNVRLVGCNSFSLYPTIQNINGNLPGRKFIVIYPDGSSDTSNTFIGIIPIPNNTFIQSDSINTVKYGVITECGYFEVSRTFNIRQKPTLGFTKVAGRCDSTVYSLGLNIGTAANYIYTLDGGQTWLNQPTNGAVSLTLKNNITYPVTFVYCGDTTTLNLYTASVGLFNATVEESNARTCNGKSSITFRGYNTNNLYWELISGPEGAVFTTTGINITGNFPSSTTGNLPLGTYIFRLYNVCGDQLYDTVELKTPYTTLSYYFSYRFECTNTTISVYNYPGGMGTPTTYILSLEDEVIRSVFGNSISTAGLVPGNQYKLRQVPSSFTCIYAEEIFTMPSSNNSLSLTNNITFNECRNTANEGALIVRPAGGYPPYTYYLYEDTLLSANRIIGPVSSNIFTNLDANKKHIVQVSDQCGRGNNISLTFSQAQLQLLNNANGTMPCEGDTLQMSLQHHPEFTYQWKKDDNNIPGATANTFTINNIQEQDNGIYELSYNVGNCQILTKSFTLATDLCDVSLLPVELVKFEASLNQTSVYLNWSTASEKVNSGFEIYHSTDGNNWQKIGFRPSKSVDGNSSTPLDYLFTHTQPLSGTNYYQLKQIDLDGAFALSNITQVDLKTLTSQIEVYPNPATSQIQFGGLPLQNKVIITNSLGQTVQVMENVQNQSPMFTKEFSKGTYTISVYTENWELLQNLKLIVL